MKDREQRIQHVTNRLPRLKALPLTERNAHWKLLPTPFRGEGEFEIRSPDAGTMMRSTGKAIVASACTGIAILAWMAFRSALPAAAVASLVDARTDKSRHHYSIVLNVRDAGTHGHARLVWTKHRSNDDWSAVAFGYYAGQVTRLTDVFDTAGKLEDETSMPPDPAIQTRLALVFWVDEDQYEATLARVGAWREAGRYRLFERDCVTFVADALAPLGLSMPSRLLLPTPTQYVVALSELNARRPPR